MRIAVIADTHDRLPKSVLEAIASADEIWHLGDVCFPSVLETIKELGPPVLVVRGNCDSTREWPESLDLSRAGLRIRLIHIPPKTGEPGIDALLHGHTHVPRNEWLGSTWMLNPGCITRPNRGAPASFGWLELHPGKTPLWSLQRL
jgi:uncharacterized protein